MLVEPRLIAHNNNLRARLDHKPFSPQSIDQFSAMFQPNVPFGGVPVRRKSGDRLGEALVKLGKVTMEDIDWVLSKQLDIPFVIVEDVTPDSELIWKFPRDFLIENRILPLFETEEMISVATEDPFNEPALVFLREKYGKSIQVSTGSGSKIEEVLKNTFKKTVFPELLESIEGVIDKIFLPKLDICCECEVVKGLVEPSHFINSLGILCFDSLYVGLENVHSCAGLQDSQQC